MTRTIKFRGKRIDNGEWVYGDLVRHYENQRRYIALDQMAYTYNTCGIDRLVSERYYEVDPNTVGQYTGVNDTNDNEIYEGDIVNNIEDDCIGVVTFGRLPYGFHQVYYIDWKGKNGQWLRKDLYFWRTKIEVIGNIYDSQEDNIND